MSAARGCAVSLSFGLLLAACATTSLPALQTPSGKPEVTVSGISKKAVVDAIANEMLTRGYTIDSVDDYVAVFTKRRNWRKYRDGKWGDSVVERRVTLNVVETAGAVRVVANLEVVSDPGKESERTSSPGGASGAAHDMQNTLERAVAAASR